MTKGIESMTVFTRLHARTLITLVIGITLGILISPISLWLQYEDRVFCNDAPRQSPKLATVLVVNSVSPSATEGNESGYESVPPPKQPLNGTVLSQSELSRGVNPPSNPKLRHRELKQELAPRKLLFVGVVTAKKYLSTRAQGIYRTWGKDIEDFYFFSSQPDDQDLHLPIITLPGINDTQYPPQRKVYTMLKYMYDHYINEFDFFMRSDDDVYVKVDQLLDILKDTNPAQDIYMGCPGFGRPNDRERIKLHENEHYCMGGPGVIFSRSALRKLGPHLDECLDSVVVSYNEDVEVGRCVSRMLRLQCTWSWETSILFWTDYKKILPSEDLYTDDVIKKAVTLHPLKDPKLMLRVHQYSQELRIKRLMRDAVKLQSDIEHTTTLLPEGMSHYGNQQWLWYDAHVNPKIRFEVPTWEYFNATRLFLTYEHMPVVGLPATLKSGINTALEVLLDVMNQQEGDKSEFYPPYHLYDGFTLMEYSSGVEFVLHMSVRREGLEEAVSYVANVFLPYQGIGMAVYQTAEETLQRVVNIVICVGKNHDIAEFLNMYEKVCLRSRRHTHLHLAMFGNNEKVKGKISQLQGKYPEEAITVHDIGDEGFSHAVGYNYVAGQLEDSELMLFFDPSFVFTAEFLDHIRMNTRQGIQAYFPVLFSFYKPELVQQFIQRPPQMLISADTGFFLRYNYQVVSLFKSDYARIGGLGTQDSSDKAGSVLNDDVRFLDRLLATDLYVMRALEPFLRRHYRPRTCKGLEGNAHTACMNSRADNIGSKKILGSLVATHDLLD